MRKTEFARLTRNHEKHGEDGMRRSFMSFVVHIILVE
jgi:hypothetical protein